MEEVELGYRGLPPGKFLHDYTSRLLENTIVSE